MRVTKIIREYVEREIHKKMREKIDSLEVVEPIWKNKEWEALHEEYLTYAEEKLDEFLASLASKREELGFVLLNPKAPNKKTYDEVIKKELIYRNEYCTCPVGLKGKIEDPTYDTYMKERDEIKAEYNAKINDILIRLELGEMKKQELEEVLAEV